MNRQTYLLLAAASSLPLGFLALCLGSNAPGAVAQTTTPASASPALLASPKAAEVVDAADAFLATLSAEQRAIAQIELKPQLAVRWTNFPGGTDQKKGGGDPAQKKAGGAAQKKGGPGGEFNFGAANYMIAFLGKPSKTDPWILQLGGHHLAINFYYKGTVGTATPYHVAAQPTVWKDDHGKTHDPLAPMRDSLRGLLASLTPEQSRRAKLEARFNDVYVGPGKDGKFPAKSEGVPVSELSDVSKGFVRKAIEAWTGDSPQGLEYRKLYLAELDKVNVSYSGTTNVGGELGDYVRLDGPRVWIEFATQGSDHYHTIWRDRLTDYGAEFSF